MSQSAAINNTELPITKAGMFLYGRGQDQRWYCAMPFTEGRFADRVKYYVLPKGSMDPGETNPLETALREFEEETGIETEKLLGANGKAALVAGKCLRNWNCPGYPGVKILNMNPEPIADHTYRSAYGKQHRSHYFSLEVDGIEKLKPHLKTVIGSHNYPNTRVQRRAYKMARTVGHPTLEELIGILRTGVVPALANKSWTPKEPKRIINAPKLIKLEEKWLKAQGVTNRKIRQSQEWLSFVRGCKGEDYKPFIDDLEKLQQYFSEIGLVDDKKARLKLDIRDRPLNFYQESAEILPLEEIVARIYKLAATNSYYARAMFGEHDDPKHPAPQGSERHKSGQVFPFFNYFNGIAPEEIAQGAQRLPNGKPLAQTEDEPRRAAVLRVLDARNQKSSENLRR
jgi:8-oxo-dGTP pyrophosphatase MutT (NUDIX family)